MPRFFSSSSVIQVRGVSRRMVVQPVDPTAESVKAQQFLMQIYPGGLNVTRGAVTTTYKPCYRVGITGTFKKILDPPYIIVAVGRAGWP